LGLAGVIYHYRSDRQGFLITGLLFFLMSFALVIYLNEVPNTPRERDYVYVGSFYVFCIWIGFGALFLFGYLQKLMSEKVASVVALSLCLMLSPILLLAQNYDDHNRAGR
jgi:hypothetical protein